MRTTRVPSAQTKDVWARLASELEAKVLLRPRYVDEFGAGCEAVVALARAGEPLGVAGPVVQRDGALVSNPASREFARYFHIFRAWAADFGLAPASLTAIARASTEPAVAGKDPSRLLG